MSKGKRAAEDRAWKLGQDYGEQNPLADVPSTEHMYQAAVQAGCPLFWFDVFKYGAQSVWRQKGEVPR